jgi:class 3 adenylate cyclase/tetratricopeptide (TPR) repeat protein
VSCPSCGAAVPADARFCPSCGHGLHVPADERRVVTVLFGDLVGFTSLAEARDPEQVKNLVDRCFARLADDIRSFGGSVDKVIGDAVVALFGAPVAHEDDAERAVRAALQMQRTLADEAEALGVDVQMRIGVNTGEVLVGAIRAGGDYTAMGDVVNTASRLQTIAEPGTVVVGPDTYAATSGVFRYEPLGLLQARGREASVDAWRPVEALVEPGRRPPRRVSSRLVGRDVEVSLLGGFLENAFDHRRPSLVLLLGEAGLGKSRLAEEVVLRSIASHQTRVLTGRAVPYGAANVWWPIAEVMRSACGVVAGDTPEEAREKCERTVRGTLDADEAEVVRTVEALLYLIGIGGSLVEVESKRAQEEVARAVRSFIEALASERPLVVTLGDVQWADISVLAGLDDLLSRTHRVPIVVLLTARPELEAHWRPSSTLQNLLVLNLDPLGDTAATELLTSLLGSEPDPAVRAELVERSGGNPLFLEELAAVLAAREGESVGALPATLRGIVAARLDALPPAERAVLDDAAVVGRRGPLAALLALGSGRTGVVEAVDELVAKDLLVLDGGLVEFRSDLVREVVYGTLTKAERARRHALHARWLESQTEDVASDEALGEIGRHWVAAADLDAELGGVDGVPPDVRQVAVDALKRAGQRAEDRELHAVARRVFSSVLRLVGDEPSADRRHALVGRAIAAAALRDDAAAEADVDLAEAEALAAGDDVVLARALTVRGDVLRNRGEFAASLEHLERARDLWRKVGNRRGEGSALRRIGWTQLFAGDLAAAEPVMLEALEAFREAGAPRGEAWALQNLAWVAFGKDEPDVAEARLQESMALFREIGDWGGLVWATGMLAWIRFSQSRIAEAETLAEQGRADADEQRDRWQVAMMTVLLANIRLWQGRVDEAVVLGEQAMASFGELGDEWGQAQATGPLVRALVLSGRFAEATRVREAATEQAERRPGLATFQGTPRVATATAAVAVGNPERALSTLQELGEAAGIGAVELRVTQGLALLQLGRTAEATAVLEEAAAGGHADAVVACALALVAGGRTEEGRRRANEALEAKDASYRSNVFARLALAAAAVRDGDRATATAEIDVATRLISSTSDRVTAVVVAVARAAVLAALDEPFASGAEADAEARMAELGLLSRGWPQLFAVATGASAAPV